MNHELLKKIKEFQKKYPNQSFYILQDGTIERSLDRGKKLKQRNEDLILSTLVGIPFGFFLSFVYDIIQEMFNLNIYIKVILPFGSFIIFYKLIKLVLKNEFGISLK